MQHYHIIVFTLPGTSDYYVQNIINIRIALSVIGVKSINSTSDLGIFSTFSVSAKTEGSDDYRSLWLSGRASASGSGRRGFESRPCHTKGVKMVPVATFLGAQHYKASTGFHSPNLHRTTIIATLTKSPTKVKSDNNQCLYSLEDRMEDWQLC